MVEYIVIGLFVSFGLIPGVFGDGLSYKDDFILGNMAVLVIAAAIIAVLVILMSLNHVISDGPSLIEIYNSKFTG